MGSVSKSYALEETNGTFSRQYVWPLKIVSSFIKGVHHISVRVVFRRITVWIWIFYSIRVTYYVLTFQSTYEICIQDNLYPGYNTVVLIVIKICGMSFDALNKQGIDLNNE